MKFAALSDLHLEYLKPEERYEVIESFQDYQEHIALVPGDIDQVKGITRSLDQNSKN